MIYFFIALFLLFSVLCTLLLAKTRIMIEYREENLKIVFRNFFMKYTLDSEKIDRMSNKGKQKKMERSTTDSGETDKTPDGFLKRVERYRDKYLATREIIDTFLRAMRYRISFSQLYTGIDYGTGDAASTGILYGVFWGLIGNIYSFLCRFFYIPFPEVELRPAYDRKCFRIEAEGIITVRLVHIIIAAVRSYRIYLKHKKEKRIQGGK